MFSVIIPLYNKEKYIERSVRSVLAQDYDKFELIIINDGSTDNSMFILSKIHDRRIRVINQDNKGVSAARNTGLRYASNEFVAFLDADDYWMSDFLSTIMHLITTFPEARLFATSIIVEDKKHTRTLKPSTIRTNLLISDYCKQANIFITSSVCIHKQVFNKVGLFPLKIKRGEDLDTWLRIACNYRIAYCCKPKAIYYKGTDNNSTQGIYTIFDSFPYWKWYNYEYFYKKSLYKYTTKQIIGLSYAALRNNKIDEAIFCLRKIQGKQCFVKDLLKKWYIIFLLKIVYNDPLIHSR